MIREPSASAKKGDWQLSLDEVIEQLEWLRKQHGGNVVVPCAKDIRYVFNGDLPEILFGTDDFEDCDEKGE